MITLDRYDTVLFLDCEYTCKEDSLATGWSDPSFPMEALQVGFVYYDNRNKAVVDTFERFVKPRINPEMTNYCVDLLGFDQNEINSASRLEDVADEIKSFLPHEAFTAKNCTCSWGNDRNHLKDELKKYGYDDPFIPMEHVDLGKIFKEYLGKDPQKPMERLAIKQILGIPIGHYDHTALGDSFDLIDMYEFLRKLLSKKD